MANRITLDELKSYLWQSAVLLRTNIDAGAYKQYIFPLMFFKRICDVYDEETAQAIEKYGEDIDLYPEHELHKFIVPKGHHWNDVRQVTEDVGAAIVSAFREIEKANGEKMVGIFGDGAWTNKNRLPDRLLRDLLEHFSSRNLSLENCPEDELGQGYEYLIKKFADDSGHTAQEFYTNRTVVHLMTEMLQPQSGESVYDPTCGSAGMLISCIAYLKDQGKEWRNLQVYGQEINQLTSAIGRMNLFLHGIEDFHVVNDDTLKNPAFIERGQLKQFDLVLANPPFSVDLDNDTKKTVKKDFMFGEKKNSENLFVERWYQLLRENGRLAAVLPESVFDTTENKYIRLFLYKYFKIKAVVSLPQLAFEPYTSTKTSILFAQKKTKAEVDAWNNAWDEASKEWKSLKTRVDNLVAVHDGVKQKAKLPSVRDLTPEDEAAIIRRMLKAYITVRDDGLSAGDLIQKYHDELESLCTFDKDTQDAFGYVNTWWVFGEVATLLNYSVFTAEAEKIGYKRTKRGEKKTDNELYRSSENNIVLFDDGECKSILDYMRNLQWD